MSKELILCEQKWKLSHDGVVEFVGSEFECYEQLQRSQPQSAMWAMAHEDWTIEIIKEKL